MLIHPIYLSYEGELKMQEEIRNHIINRFEHVHEHFSKEMIPSVMYAYLSGLLDGKAISGKEFIQAANDLDDWCISQKKEA